ncbi:MAG: helix-turn-helix transcriptional regulator [Acidobacteria bacterium]|nr:helix-turn-helix transcriptional regulator [Acidobacteriota bacterium]
MRESQKVSSQVKRGSAELAVLTVLAQAPLHGYEIAKRIRQQTGGVVSFDVASLYPLLYAMERRGWVKGSWEQAASGRQRRYYRLTPEGRRRLQPLRREWRAFFRALNRLARLADA